MCAESPEGSLEDLLEDCCVANAMPGSGNAGTRMRPSYPLTFHMEAMKHTKYNSLCGLHSMWNAHVSRQVRVFSTCTVCVPHRSVRKWQAV